MRSVDVFATFYTCAIPYADDGELKKRKERKQMKKLSFILTLIIVLGIAAETYAQTCTTIQSGTLLNSAGSTILPGYDEWGYNYQAQIFNGTYCDAYRNAAWCQEWVDVNLLMKWNSPWLSNMDCDTNGLLDRHFGYASYIGSGAWTTNHQSGKVLVNGKMRNWTYFVKIVAVEPDDVLVADKWMRGGRELGPMIWNEFAVVEEVLNDPSAGAHGILYKSPINPGFGSNP